MIGINSQRVSFSTMVMDVDSPTTNEAHRDAHDVAITNQIRSNTVRL